MGQISEGSKKRTLSRGFLRLESVNDVNSARVWSYHHTFGFCIRAQPLAEILSFFETRRR
jgi:hypothetical protein